MLTFRAAIGNVDKVGEKKSHAEVGYQYEPKGDEQCALCSMYRPSKEFAKTGNNCTDVVDPIVPQGWCRIFDSAKLGKGVADIVGSAIGPVEGGTEDHVCELRTECARTGNSLIDAVLNGPITSRNINKPIVSRFYDVPYGAGGSEPFEDPTTFVDCHIPERMTAPRESDPSKTVSFDLADPYLVHENVEQAVMDKLIAAGMDPEAAYKVAHYLFAEVAEGAWYEAHDIDRDAAEEWENVFLRQIQHEAPENPPPNLYEKPYPHHDIWMAQHERFDESYPTDAEKASALAILESIYGVPYENCGETEKRETAGDLRAAVYAMLLKEDPRIAALMAPEIAAEVAKVRDGLMEKDMKKIWASNADLPDGVKSLPGEAQTVFRRVANDRMKAGAGELSAIRQAWTAVKNGWEKKGDEWVRKDGRYLSAEEQAVLDSALRRSVIKTQPTASDVHATTALGNEGRKKKKAKDFISTITEAKGKMVDENGLAVQKYEPSTIDWRADIKVTKTDEEQQLVFGWASVTHIDGEIVIDKQDDIVTSEELEKAAYDFVLYCREQGDMHERRGVGKLVESCVFTAEKRDKCGLYAFDPDTGEQLLGWFTGFKVQAPDVWKRIKAGDLPELSIGGKAVRVPVESI